MGIYDRDYYREQPRSGFGAFAPWSITTWLIVVNLAIYILDGLLRQAQLAYAGPLYLLGYFSLYTAVFHAQIWRFLTFQFLHASIMHILGNMLGLYFFGPIVEGQLGARRFLAFYLISGLGGAAMYVALWGIGVLGGGPYTPMVGASAGIFGVLVAAAYVAPDMQLTLWIPIPMQLPLRVWAWVAVGMAAIVVFSSGQNAGGEAAHLGGALVGFTLIRQQHLLNLFAPGRRRYGMANRGRGKKRRVAFKDWTKDMNH